MVSCQGSKSIIEYSHAKEDLHCNTYIIGSFLYIDSKMYIESTTVLRISLFATQRCCHLRFLSILARRLISIELSHQVTRYGVTSTVFVAKIVIEFDLEVIYS